MGLFGFNRKNIDEEANLIDGVISSRAKLEQINEDIELLKKESDDIFDDYLQKTKQIEKSIKKTSKAKTTASKTKYNTNC